jgi:hypothetical protein
MELSRVAADMNVPGKQTARRQTVSGPRFKPIKIIIPVLLALLSISLMSQWYANNISFPRYCKSPERALNAVQVLLQDEPVIDDNQRRRYMIAAKILFLQPKNNHESKSDYMLRLRHLMLAKCQ